MTILPVIDGGTTGRKAQPITCGSHADHMRIALRNMTKAMITR